MNNNLSMTGWAFLFAILILMLGWALPWTAVRAQAWDPTQWTRVGSAISPATWTPVLVNANTSPPPGCPTRPTSQDYIALTQASADLQGAAWFGAPVGATNQKVDLTKPFDITFQVYLGNQDGADGIAFVLQNDTRGRNAVAAAGAGSAMGYSGITPSVVVELDTYQNSGSPIYDPQNDHVGIMTGGSPNHNSSGNNNSCNNRTTMPGGCVTLSNLENSAWHTLRVTWTYTSSASQRLRVYVNGGTTPTTSLTGNIISSYLGGATTPYMGLTAGTGGENNCHAFYISNIANITYTPTLAVISSFQVGSDGVVQWETASEVGTVGFNLLRQDPASGEFAQVNNSLLPGLLTAPQGGVYRYPDPGVSSGGTYTYLLQEVEARGALRSYGPFTVTVGVGRQISYAERARPLAAAEATPRADGYERAAHAPTGRTVSPLAARSLAATAQASASPTAIRIQVEQEGLYAVSAEQIAAKLGVTPSEAQNWIQTGKLRLRNKGQPVAWMADPSGNQLYFYGQPVEGVDRVYSRFNVYWLDRANGLKMNVLAGSGPVPAASTQPFQSSIRVEQNHYAFPYLATNPDADFWYWDYVVAGGYTPSFVAPTPGAAAAGTATLRAYLQGGSALVTGSRHHAQLLVNGVEVGDTTWEGITPHVLTATFNATVLADGNNTVTVRGVLDPGVPFSTFAVNGFAFDYPRAYQAVDNRLRLRGAGNPVVTVGGFSGSNIAVLDISDPRKPQWLAATTIPPAGGSVSFIPATPATDYLAAVATAPASAEGATATTLRTQNSGAEYLVLAPRSLRAGADVLAAHRSGKVVELQDIYDAFNDGIANPNAIRDFLRYAYRNWQPRPRHVALVGKGTIDPKDDQRLGTNLFPVLMAATPDGLFAADNRYADFDNNGVPELGIGRIPALTSDDVTQYVAKLQTYESGGPTATALLVADNPDNAGNFTTDSDAVKQSLLAKGVTAKPIYHQAGTAANLTRQGIIDGINAGVGVINYVGHAGITQLANEGLLRNSDVSQLNNNSRLPLFLALTCYVGNGSISGFDSLTETLLWRQGGGIVAALAPTGMSDNTQAHVLNLSIVDTLFGGRASPTLGEATNAALTGLARRGGQRYMLDIYQVVGDPALQIQP